MQTFETLGLSPDILSSLSELGYEGPSPIQQQSIPVLLSGKDLLAQAQTGTGKTAAFALPILMQLDLKSVQTQALVLTPTRELAIQVAESFQSYAKHMANFHVLPIYGGQDFRPQLKALKRGAHIIVGTPGRVMDHLRRGHLKLDSLKTLVLDEADEMLQMGFIDDVKWIMQQIPHQHQTALFSATIPQSIQHIADQHLNQPCKIQIAAKKVTLNAIEQFYTIVSQHHKLEVITRFLEIEDFDAVIIFTRTKTASAELAERLEARGYAAAAINGDMNQSSREKVVKRVKQSAVDILVATDVAARGLDIVRITHVINYDIPQDPESYVHRIGRTGRAGRTGKTLLLVTPRERRMLRVIEKMTRQTMNTMDPPSIAQINAKRLEKFSAKIIEAYQHTSAHDDLDFYRNLVENIVHTSECSILDIAAAIAYLAQKENPLKDKQKDRMLLETDQQRHNNNQTKYKDKDKGKDKDKRKDKKDTYKNTLKHKTKLQEKGSEKPSMVTQCRIELGQKQGLKAGDIVKLFANKTKLSSKSIGQIQIYNSHTIVDIPSNSVNKVIQLIDQKKWEKEVISIRAVGKPQLRKDPSQKKKKYK